MKECNHILGMYKYDNDYDTEITELVHLDSNIRYLKNISISYNYCPNCGCNLEGIVDRQINTHDEIKRLEELKKEEKLKRENDKIISFLKTKGIHEINSNENYRIEILNPVTAYICWNTLSLVNYLRLHYLNHLESVNINMFELPTDEEINNKMLENGFVKAESDFWYGWRKGLLGVSIDRYNTYKGELCTDGSLGDSIEQFSKKQTVTTSSESLEKLIGFKFDLKRII